MVCVRYINVKVITNIIIIIIIIITKYHRVVESSNTNRQRSYSIYARYNN